MTWVSFQSYLLAVRPDGSLIVKIMENSLVQERKILNFVSNQALCVITVWVVASELNGLYIQLLFCHFISYPSHHLGVMKPKLIKVMLHDCWLLWVCLGSVCHLAHNSGTSQREPAWVGQLVKPYHIQALNYGSTVGFSGAIISKMANQVNPAALTTRPAGPVD